MSRMGGDFRVPTGSQSGGNPKKKRRTSQNTATPVVQNPDMGLPTMGPSSTVFASNPFDDNTPIMDQQGIGSGGQNMFGMSPGGGNGGG